MIDQNQLKQIFANELQQILANSNINLRYEKNKKIAFWLLIFFALAGVIFLIIFNFFSGIIYTTFWILAICLIFFGILQVGLINMISIKIFNKKFKRFLINEKESILIKTINSIKDVKLTKLDANKFNLIFDNKNIIIEIIDSKSIIKFENKQNVLNYQIFQFDLNWNLGNVIKKRTSYLTALIDELSNNLSNSFFNDLNNISKVIKNENN